ncbi:AAA family ATPase [Pseudomonas mohnii]
MVKPVLVGVTGTHSTGKSTFCDELKVTLECKGICVATIPSFGKLAVQQGIPLLTQHTYDSTMWFIDRTLEAQRAAVENAEVILVDRPIMDAVAYWNAAIEHRGTPAPAHQVDAISALLSRQIPDYTTIVATRLDSSIALGPGRDTDLTFRQSVDTHLHQLLSRFQIQHQMLFPHVREALLNTLHNDILHALGRS